MKTSAALFLLMVVVSTQTENAQYNLCDFLSHLEVSFNYI